MDLTVQISIDPAILVGLIYTVRLFLIHEQGILCSGERDLRKGPIPSWPNASPPRRLLGRDGGSD